MLLRERWLSVEALETGYLCRRSRNRVGKQVGRERERRREREPRRENGREGEREGRKEREKLWAVCVYLWVERWHFERQQISCEAA